MIFRTIEQVQWARFHPWINTKNIFHLFTTRNGGVSKGNHATLNLGKTNHDSDANVENNRRRLCSAAQIPEDRIVLARQVHSANVSIVEAPGVVQDCDGLLTSTPDLYLVIGVADCHVVFLSSQDRAVVGVLHAGWRGTAKNIIKEALTKAAAQTGNQPNNFEIAIGPGIQQCCYEVGEEVAGQFSPAVVAHRKDSSYLSLSEMLVQQAKDLGIPSDQIFRSRHCTSCEQKYWYSYRRDNGVTGRMWGIIARTGEQAE